ncbi:hypothetical protein D7Y41_25285, partial [Anaerotruncus sp. 1XD22-93]
CYPPPKNYKISSAFSYNFKLALTVIMISCEESEMLGMCHRILVMRDGEIIGEFNREDATQEKLVGLCMGGKTV